MVTESSSKYRRFSASEKLLYRVSVAALVLALVLYRPLPEKLTATWKDRVTMHILEPLARIIYFYPVRLCPTALCSLHWTRFSLELLSRITGPIFEGNSHLLMETTHWNGVKVRLYYPRDRTSAESDGAIIYIHGGGFGVGSVEIEQLTVRRFESLTRTMAEQMSTRLFVSIDYRRAPETVFPGAINDCESVLEYLVANGPEQYGIDPRKIIVMGDSAGGNLATVLTHRRRDRGAEPKLLGQVLLYPLLQFSDLQTYSYREIGRQLAGMAFVDPYSAAMYFLFYAGLDINAHPEFINAALHNGHLSEESRRVSEKYMDLALLPEAFRMISNNTDTPRQERVMKELADQMTPFLTNPDYAPLMQPDLSNLPAALVITCEFDVLRDEGTLYAQRLNQAGVPTQWTHYAHGFHGMFNLHANLAIARDAIVDVKNWTMQLLRAAENK